MSKLLLKGVICCLLLMSGVLSAFATIGNTQKQVLLLYSYHPSFPTSSEVLTGIRSVLDEATVGIDVEYMDSKRLHDEESLGNFLVMLRYQLSHRNPYDLVITVDDNALDFALRHGAELFPDTPLVFLGVNDIDKALRQNENPLVTGVVESPSIEATVRVARLLHPERDRVHIVVDDTPSGQADLRSSLVLPELFPDTTFIVSSLGDRSWSEMATALHALGENDTVLLLSAYRDSHGSGKTFFGGLEWIKASTDVPIYHLWSHGLGEGIFGGVFVSHEEQGRMAALIAQKILSGADPSAIAVVNEIPSLPMFDSRELSRFGISDADLPSNAVVLYHPDSLFDRYRSVILGVLAVLLLLSGFSGYLIRQNKRLAKLSEDLQEKSGFLRLLMNTLPDLVWMKDPDGVYLSCNRRFESFFGADVNDITGKTDLAFITPELAAQFRKNDLLAIERNQPVRNEEHLVFAGDGHEEIVETIKAPVYDDRGQLRGVLGIARDIGERRQAEEQIRILSQAIKQSPVSVMITDTDGNIEYVNSAFEQVTGYPLDEVRGRNPRLLKSGDHHSSTYHQLWDSLRNGRAWEGELRNRKKSGELFWDYAHIAPVFDDEGKVTHYLAVNEDITLRKAQDEKILMQAQYDSLTGLPNRLLSHDRLGQLIARESRSHEKTAVLYLDLDDFKRINDSLGHDTGDKVLERAADRLQKVIREQDTVGRLGGDEFIILLGGLSSQEGAAHVARQLLKQLDAPFTIEGRTFALSASIGIALHPDHGSNPGELLRKADTAMYHAKDRGRAGFAFFTTELDDSVNRRFTLEHHLTSALALGELQVHYQPQVDLHSGNVVGIEALLRWYNPELGQVSPAEFIPIAEQNGAILAIGRFVLREALSKLEALCSSHGSILKLAINLSPNQFRDANLIDDIKAALKDTGQPASVLELEITEGVLMERRMEAEEILAQLHDLGVGLSMDDFGTGYSSLSYLRRYPFDSLKIDRSFINGIATNKADRELVSATIAMAHHLGLTLTAEGVETMEQRDILVQLGCEYAQGYLFGRAVTAEEFEALLPVLQGA